jgi:MFS family permease
VLLVGFAMLPLRGLLLTLITDPDLVVLVQVLDGIAAACFGIMIPLVTSDIAGRSRHYTLSLGLIGFAMGIGATLSTTIAGFIADELGDAAAFAGMAGIGIGAVLLVAFAMPETRPLRANSPATRNAGAAESRNPDRAA